MGKQGRGRKRVQGGTKESLSSEMHTVDLISAVLIPGAQKTATNYIPGNGVIVDHGSV